MRLEIDQMSSFRKPLTIYRYEGKPVLQGNGKFILPAQESFVIKASVQPLKATEMDALPEGRRGSHAVKVYSDTELYMADQGTGIQADQFEWLGRKYEIIAADAYQCGVISHCMQWR